MTSDAAGILSITDTTQQDSKLTGSAEEQQNQQDQEAKRPLGKGRIVVTSFSDCFVVH